MPEKYVLTISDLVSSWSGGGMRFLPGDYLVEDNGFIVSDAKSTSFGVTITKFSEIKKPKIEEEEILLEKELSLQKYEVVKLFEELILENKYSEAMKLFISYNNVKIIMTDDIQHLEEQIELSKQAEKDNLYRKNSQLLTEEVEVVEDTTDYTGVIEVESTVSASGMVELNLAPESASKNLLLSQQLKSSGKQPDFVCDLCDSKHSNISSLKRHMKAVHSAVEQ